MWDTLRQEPQRTVVELVRKYKDLVLFIFLSIFSSELYRAKQLCVVYSIKKLAVGPKQFAQYY